QEGGGMVGVDQVASVDPTEASAQGRSVASGHEGLHDVKFREADPQAKTILEHAFQVLEADPMDDMLVHRPTLQPVEVFVSPLVTFWQEGLFALLAPIAVGRAVHNLPPHATRGKLQVVGELDVFLVQPGGPFPLASRTRAAPDLDFPISGQLPRLPPFPVQQAGSPDHLVGTEVDLLSLVVEEGTAVDVVEF